MDVCWLSAKQAATTLWQSGTALALGGGLPGTSVKSSSQPIERRNSVRADPRTVNCGHDSAVGTSRFERVPTISAHARVGGESSCKAPVAGRSSLDGIAFDLFCEVRLKEGLRDWIASHTDPLPRVVAVADFCRPALQCGSIPRCARYTAIWRRSMTAKETIRVPRVTRRCGQSLG